MSLQSIININVDFYDKKYILINAKQLDKGSRFLLVSCYNHGTPFSLDYASQSAYIRYKKADDYSVFNLCKINSDGKILVELTEQMLAVAGISTADLIIVNKRMADVDEDSLEVIVKNAEILSTMTFFIDVSEIATENSEIESSYEYSGLNDTLAKANADYDKVIKWARSYATGDGGVRYNEATDNAKYYYEQSLENAESANASEDRALSSANNAYNSATSASRSASSALNSANSALNSANIASDKADTALSAAITAQSSMNTTVEKTALAVESATNAQNAYLQAATIVNGLNGAFLPKGTITYTELIELNNNGMIAAGHLYQISDDFTTDENFRVSEREYSAGTSVYYTVDNKFDIFVGTTVVGVKGNEETVYRTGKVNITVENIGAISNSDIATVDEIKTYLGI